MRYPKGYHPNSVRARHHNQAVGAVARAKTWMRRIILLDTTDEKVNGLAAQIENQLSQLEAMMRLRKD
jgi:hypothetical protein